MRLQRLTIRVVLIVGCLVLPLSCGPTDTGFIGTWEREFQGTNSRLILWEEGQEIRFRWNLMAEDGMAIVTCDEGETCLEKMGDEIMYEYEFKVSRREGSEDLFVSCKGTPTDSDKPLVDYTDMIEVVAGGMELHSWKVELNGKPISYSQPLVFKKVSD